MLVLTLALAPVLVLVLVHAVGAIGKVVFDAHKIMSELPHCLRSLVAKELYSEMGRSVAMLSRLPRMLNTRGVRE